MRHLRKLSFLIVSMIFWGCQTQPKIPENMTRDESLAQLKVDAIADMDSVGFEWNYVNNHQIKGFIIYRGEPDQKLTSVAVVGNRFATHFVDTKDLVPNKDYIYKISYFTDENRESTPSKNVNVKTLPLPEKVSFIESIPNLPRMSKIIFRPHPDRRVNGYIIEKRVKGEENFKEIAKIKGRLNAEYFDTNLKDNSEYEYRVLATTHSGHKTEPSDIVITVTKPLPPSPTELVASQNLPRKIELKWQRVSGDENGQYNIYSSSSESFGFRKIGSFKASGATEKLEEDGASRFYKVTFTDKDELESPMPEKAIKGQTLVKPNAPKITKLAFDQGKISLEWEVGDSRNVKFVVKRATIAGLISKDKKEFETGANPSFVDSEIAPATTYQYQIVGVDEFGIVSFESDKAKITVDSHN